MNKENLQKVIDAIKFDGKTKFNMHTFIGKFDESYYNERVFKNGDLASLYRPSQVQNVETGTDIFNCTSMGCIAGFATAISNNWKAPEWLADKDMINFSHKFETESNEFLGFSQEEGKNIYYNDSNCIWKWLMHNEPDTYPGLKLEDVDGDECYSMDEAMEYGYHWNDDNLCVDFASIDYLTAVNVLTRILNEEIGLADKHNEPYYIMHTAEAI